MSKYLDKESYTYDFSDTWNRNHNKTKIINQYKDLLGDRVADLGSNSGYQCFITAEFNEIKEVVGIDINKEAINFGNTVIRKKFPKIVRNKVNFRVCDLNNIMSKDEYFDSIITFHTLEHIFPDDLDKVIDEKYRILKKGGYVIASMPYNDAFPDKKHVNFFDEDSLTKVFEAHGFETVECYQDNRMSDNPNQLCLTAIFRK